MAGSFRWLFFLWVLTVFDAFDIFLTPCKPGSQGLIFLGADWFASVSKNCQKPSSGLRLRFQRFWMLSTYGDAARHPLAVDSSRFFDGFWHLTLLTVLTPCQPGLPEKIRGIDKASCRGLRATRLGKPVSNSGWADQCLKIQNPSRPVGRTSAQPPQTRWADQY